MHLDSASAAARSATEDSLDPVAGRIDASLRQTLLPLLTIVRQQDGVWRSCLGKGHAGAVPPLYRRTLLTLRDCARSVGAVPLADIASQLIMLLEQHTADSPLAPPRLRLLEQGLDQLTRLLDAPGTPAVLTLPGSEAPVPIIANVMTPHDVIDPGLLPVFLEEAQELMASIGETLLALPPGHSHTPADTDLLAELARPLHTLKGSARMVGAMRLSQCVHEMESALQRLQTGEAAQNAEVLTALLALYDQTMEHFSTLEQAAASVPAASRSGGLQSPCNLISGRRPCCASVPLCWTACSIRLAKSRSCVPGWTMKWRPCRTMCAYWAINCAPWPIRSGNCSGTPAPVRAQRTSCRLRPMPWIPCWRRHGGSKNACTMASAGPAKGCASRDAMPANCSRT
ncbi:Hpt domain-containing protein [Herbaspirillum frisingense]|uniref:Hpt domain-containing protein n=1 Tax=Herbaspirillum frisingense TaxID=92645 RepID=UPI001F31101F|nr:Hpt domain-containing protein [Herbaspirillum frisingense]